MEKKRSFEITVNSASGLEDVRMFGQMRVFVVVFISNDEAGSKQKTQVDETDNTNPTWNSIMSFSITETDLQRNNNIVCLVFQLHYKRTLGDRCFGEVSVPLKDLFANFSAATAPQFASYPVINLNNCHKGLLHFSYRFLQLASASAQINYVNGIPVSGGVSSGVANQGFSAAPPYRHNYSMPSPWPPLPRQPSQNYYPQRTSYPPQAIKSHSSSANNLAKAGLAIGAGSLLLGSGSFAVNTFGLVERYGEGGGDNDGGHGGAGGDTGGSGHVVDDNNNVIRESVESGDVGWDPLALEDPNGVVFGMDEHHPSWIVDDHNYVVDHGNIVDSSTLNVDQSYIPDVSSLYIPDFSGAFIG